MGRGTPMRDRPGLSWAIPIVDRERRIIGWSDYPPTLRGNDIWNVDAARLLGPRLGTVEIELANIEDAMRAGAPTSFTGPWRCLAICRKDDVLTGFEFTPEPVSAAHVYQKRKAAKRGEDG